MKKKSIFSKIILTSLAVILSLLSLHIVMVNALDSNTKLEVSRVNYPGGPESTGYFDGGKNNVPGKQYDQTSYLEYRVNGNLNVKDLALRNLTTKYYRAYCLDSTKEYPEKANNMYNYVSSLENYKELAGLTPEKKKQIYYLLANTYIPVAPANQANVDKADMDARKAKIYEKAYKAVNPGVTDKRAIEAMVRGMMYQVTDDDMNMINQTLIWYIAGSMRDRLPSSQVIPILTNGQEQGFDGERKKFIGYVWDYLLNDAVKNGSNYEIDNQIEEDLQNALGTNAGQSTRESADVFTATKLYLDLDENTTLEGINVLGQKQDGKEVNIPADNVEVYLSTNPEQKLTLNQLVQKVRQSQGQRVEFNLTVRDNNLDQYLKILVQPTVKYTIFDSIDVYKNEKQPTSTQPIIALGQSDKKVNLKLPLPVPPYKAPVKSNDLALRKFITSIDGKAPEVSRVPNVDTTNLENEKNPSGKNTTAQYKHPKNPLEVKHGSKVVYTIRVFNETTEDQKVTEICDYLPNTLEFVQDSQINKDNGWTFDSQTNIAKTNKHKDTIIKGVNGEGQNETLNYVDVQIELKVKPIMQTGQIATNIAYVQNQTPLPDRDSVPGFPNKPSQGKALENYTGRDNFTVPELGNKDKYYPGRQDIDDFEKVILNEPEKPQPKQNDLALRKFITKIDGKSPEVSREPNVDTANLENDKNPSGTSTTAEYKHPKNPLAVEHGSKVIYTIRVFNETTEDQKVTKINDYIPNTLEFVQDSKINKENEWTFDANTNIASTPKHKDHILKGVTGEGKDQKLDYVDVQIELQVKDALKTGQIATNIAYVDGQTPLPDRDSTPGFKDLPSQGPDLENYTGKDKLPVNELGDKDRYYPGKQDIDDFEKVVLKEPKKENDLALRKFITEVDGKKPEVSRVPDVDAKNLENDKNKNGTDTTAQYKHPKNPLEVKIGSKVVYTIRVYNETTEDQKVTKINDYIPNTLEFVKDSKINQENGWTFDEKTNIASTTKHENFVIKGVKGEGQKETLNYVDVQIELQVKGSIKPGQIATNIAYVDGQTPLPDRDSKPGYPDLPSQGPDLEHYTGKDRIPESQLGDKDRYYPGKQDTDDFEKVVVKPEIYDFALKKFISEQQFMKDGKVVKEEKYPNRVPQVNVRPLLEGKTNADYTKVKDPALVLPNSIVTYTIRVYNEGPNAGYVGAIDDDIPQGLIFLPDNPINKKYGWKLVKKEADGKFVPTTQLEGARIYTEYLSKENGTQNLIPAFNKETRTLSYKDVQVAFKIAPNYKKDDGIITNTAQIDKITNPEGKEVPDIDSTPGNDKPGEDDIDKERVRTGQFDLALEKIVTQAIVTINGKTQVIDVGNAFGKPKKVAKVEIEKDNWGTETIKYQYKIRVTNQGTIPGYATEVQDHIPQGLVFLPNENPQWYKVNENTVGTKALANVLLQPGEYRDLTIYLGWTKSKDNLTLKTNWAEISKDKNEYGLPDIDSTPGNNSKREDDEDSAQTIVSVSTGLDNTYFIVTLTTLAAVASGVALFKKRAFKVKK